MSVRTPQPWPGRKLGTADERHDANDALVEQAAGVQSLKEQAKNPGGAVTVFVLRQSTEGTVASERRQAEEQLEVPLAYQEIPGPRRVLHFSMNGD